MLTNFCAPVVNTTSWGSEQGSPFFVQIRFVYFRFERKKKQTIIKIRSPLFTNMYKIKLGTMRRMLLIIGANDDANEWFITVCILKQILVFSLMLNIEEGRIRGKGIVRMVQPNNG